MTSTALRAGTLCVSLAAALVPTPAAEPEWPQFRGAASNPVSTQPRLPEQWSLKERIEWTAQIPGRGWSSPIVTGGRIYLTTVTTDGKSKPPQVGTEYSNQYVAELSKQGLSQQQVIEKVTERDIELPKEVTVHYILYCLNLKTGDVAWQKEFFAGRPPGGRHRKNSFASETPVTDGKLVYVYIGNLGLYAFDRGNGKLAWQTPLEANPIYLDFGTGASPVLHGNQLLIQSDNEKQQYLAAFDKKTGKLLWRTNRDLPTTGSNVRRSGWVTPYVWSNPVRTEIVTISPGAAVSYDLEGKELWRLAGTSEVPVPSPFASDGLLFVDAGYGRGLYAIRPGAKGDISLAKDTTSSEFVAWSVPRAGTYLPTPVAYDGALYVLSETGILSRYDIKTGKQTYKSRIHPEAGHFTSSPWAYNGKIFCLNEEGKTYVISAGETFQLLHENPLDEMALATPALVGDRLLLRTETKLYSIRAPTP